MLIVQHALLLIHKLNKFCDSYLIDNWKFSEDAIVRVIFYHHEQVDHRSERRFHIESLREEIYFLCRRSGHINGNKPLWKCSVNRSMTKRDVVLRSPPFAVPGFDFQEGGAAGLGGIIELCQDINYNQKQLFCAPETLSAPLPASPLPSVAPVPTIPNPL